MATRSQKSAGESTDGAGEVTTLSTTSLMSTVLTTMSPMDPFKVSHEEPPLKEFAPVFIEETLMLRKDMRMRELETWNFTVGDPSEAVFYMVCCGPIDRLLELPSRTPERPYLCYDCEAILHFGSLQGRDCQQNPIRCDSKLVKLLARRDFMFSSSDLRGWSLKNDSALLVPGITHVHNIPAPEKLRKNKVQPSVPPKYFLTFQGIRNQGLEGASYVRGNLEATLNASLNAPTAVRLPGGQQRPVENITRLPNDVYIAIANKAQRHKELRPYFSLFDSACSLVLHGHGRWSYRLLEVLNGEAIPVILADGWQLPLDELIHWDQISLRRSEELSMDPAALVDSLPRDSAIIESTRARIREVYAKLMETQEKRTVSLLRAAALWKRNWKELEKGTLRMLADAALQGVS